MSLNSLLIIFVVANCLPLIKSLIFSQDYLRGFDYFKSESTKIFQTKWIGNIEWPATPADLMPLLGCLKNRVYTLINMVSTSMGLFVTTRKSFNRLERTLAQVLNPVAHQRGFCGNQVANLFFLKCLIRLGRWLFPFYTYLGVILYTFLQTTV